MYMYMTRICIHILHMYTCTRVCISICMDTHVYTYIYVHAGINKCMYTVPILNTVYFDCMYIHVHIVLLCMYMYVSILN